MLNRDGQVVARPARSAKPMKLLYFAPADIQIARVDRQMLVYFCEALYRLGVDVELIAMGIKLLALETKANHPLELYRIKGSFPVKIKRVPVHQESADFWCALNRLWVHVTEGMKHWANAGGNKRMVFYARNYATVLMFSLLKFFSRTKPLILMEVHTTPKTAVQRFLLPKADGIVANSFALARDLVANESLSARNVIGTHMGVNLELYNELRVSKREARQKLGLPLHRKIALYAGKIYWGYKEPEYILTAAQLLPDDIEVMLVGGREDHVKRFRERAAAQNISNAIFTGFVPPKLVQYYQIAADVLLLYYPSGMDLNKYRSPGKLFEYMASGRPIIAADYPVLREILGEEPAALLVPPDSPALLAQNIETLLADHHKMEDLAARALARVGQFTWEARATRILDFIETIAA